MTWMDIEDNSPLQSDMSLLDTLHVEADGGNGAMANRQRNGDGHGLKEPPRSRIARNRQLEEAEPYC